jgi:hypothetical protein
LFGTRGKNKKEKRKEINYLWNKVSLGKKEQVYSSKWANYDGKNFVVMSSIYLAKKSAQALPSIKV